MPILNKNAVICGLMKNDLLMALYVMYRTDGQEGQKGIMFNEMRSKTKVLQKPVEVGGVFPDWSFDGSSTEQATGNNSDCILRPCFSCPDPIRGGNNVLVLCEVMDSMGVAHPTNTRAQLRELLDDAVTKEDPW